VWPTEPAASPVIGAPDESFNEYYAGGNDSDSDEFDMNRFGQLVPPHSLSTPLAHGAGATISFPFRVEPGLPPSLRQTPGDQHSHHGGHELRDDSSVANTQDAKRFLRIRGSISQAPSSGQNLPISHVPRTPEHATAGDTKTPQAGEAAGFRSDSGTGKRSASIQTDIMRTKSLFFFARELACSSLRPFTRCPMPAHRCSSSSVTSHAERLRTTGVRSNAQRTAFSGGM